MFSVKQSFNTVKTCDIRTVAFIWEFYSMQADVHIHLFSALRVHVYLIAGREVPGQGCNTPGILSGL